jgi:regulatory protein
MKHARQARRPERPLRPLDDPALRALALAYVGRYATTRARLAAYLQRKLSERPWQGDAAPDIEAIVAEFAALGYVDDALFARNRAGALFRRGYGPRRVKASLDAAGIEGTLAEEGARIDEEDALRAALAFARRKRIGPFARDDADDAARARAFSAMARAGHSFAIARRVLAMDLNETHLL